MNLKIFKQRLLDNDIEFDMMGHGLSRINGKPDVAKKRFKEYIISKLNFIIKYAEEQKEKAYLQKIIYCDLNDPRYDYIMLVGALEYECHNCGKLHYAYMKDKNTVSLAQPILKAQSMEFEFDKSTPCEFANGFVPTKTSVIFPTGNLTFVNHFGEYPETPEGKEYDDEFSLNNLRGRINIAKYLANENIGYGQVGNTSIQIFVSKDRKHIRICEHAQDFIDDTKYMIEKYPDKVTEADRIKLKQTIALIEGYEYIGSISLGVWRWMVADNATIKDKELKINNNQDHSDSVECKVQPGKWNIIHYYDISGRDTVLISELIKEDD